MMTSQDRGEYDLVLQRAKNDLAIAESHESTVRQLVRDAESSIQESSSDASLLFLRLLAIDAKEQLQLSTSRLREVKLRRAVPLDALTARIPASRDFVAERLTIQIDSLRERLQAITNQIESVANNVEPGDKSSIELPQLNQGKIGIERKLVYLGDLVKLRERFLQNEFDAQSTEVQALKRKFEFERAMSEIRKLQLSSLPDTDNELPPNFALQLQPMSVPIELRLIHAKQEAIDAVTERLKELR